MVKVALWIFWLGCSGSQSTTSPFDLPRPEVDASWQADSLPIGGSTVDTAKDNTIELHYDPAKGFSRDQVIDAFRKSYGELGYTSEQTGAIPQAKAIQFTFKKTGSPTIEAFFVGASEQVEVHLERLN